MNELDLKKETSPDTLSDLVKFVWVTKEEVTARRSRRQRGIVVTM